MPKPAPTFQQLTPHIYKLDLPYFGIGVGVFLVRHAEGWTVVDAGAPQHVPTIFEQVLRQTGGQRPVRLILTHGHLDHAAGAEKMRAEWNVLIAAGRDEIAYLVGPRRYNTIPADNLLYRLTQASPVPLVGRNVQLPLDEDMEIDGMRVLAAPGHAPGMVALLHLADRALLCADTFAVQNGRPSDPPTMFTYDRRLNRQSQLQVTEPEFEHLIPSHGAPILGNARTQARAHALSRLR
jgi:glyoxylase-like metal-dependent hydrolase (beta-lactamase superfamily II)